VGRGRRRGHHPLRHPHHRGLRRRRPHGGRSGGRGGGPVVDWWLGARTAGDGSPGKQGTTCLPVL
jgi:hypothetical protein